MKQFWSDALHDAAINCLDLSRNPNRIIWALVYLGIPHGAKALWGKLLKYTVKRN